MLRCISPHVARHGVSIGVRKVGSLGTADIKQRLPTIA